ncbi:MAG: DedA family protein [Spirochaetia bacterium]|nr:DedA family protein [Spirochaetia bacterium]
METVAAYIQQNLEIAPVIIVLLLTLAGANIPLSEDVINITAALMAVMHPHYAVKLLASVLIGAYLGDTVSYWVGRGAGHLMLAPKGSERRESFKKKVAVMSVFLHKRDVIALIFGRFIPFGFRNILHMTSGIIRISFVRYILLDIPAVLVTTGFLFTLVFLFGRHAADILKTAEIVFLGFLVFASIGYLVWRKTWKRCKTAE